MTGSPPPPSPLHPRTAAEESQTAELVTAVQTRVTEIVASFRKPSTFTPHDAAPVVIASWMKSGTTLTQQLIYQLFVLLGRVPSDPAGTSFDDISSVVPFIEMTHVGPARSAHAYAPSVWKTHSLPSEFRGGAYARARFLVAVRDGRAVMRSFADFAAEWVTGRKIAGEARGMFYERFFRAFFLACDDGGRGRAAEGAVEWFESVRAWRDEGAVRGRVLFLVYEDVVGDVRKAVRDVAGFIGVAEGEVTDGVVEEVARRCSRERMVGDARFLDRIVAREMGLDEKGGRRVRGEGMQGGFRDVVSEGTAREYEAMFERTFGVKTYEELKEQLRERNREVLGERGRQSD